MNIDLLIKLLRLATNNPNDNEANLAARRACKMLIEAIDSGHLNFKPRNSNPTKGTTWNDVKRSSEPQWSSPGPQQSQYYDNPFDFFKRYYDQKNKRERYNDPYTHKWTWEPNRVLKCTQCNQPFDTRYQGPIEQAVCTECRRKYPDRKWKNCSSCNKSHWTAYVGNLFICNNCQYTEKWEEFKKKNV